MALLTGCRQRAYDPVSHVIDQIQQDYVERMHRKEINRKILEKIFLSLDPYSTYLPPEHYRRLNELSKGQVYGIGLELSEEEGKILVVAPIAGSPAEKAGIRSGDIVTHINGILIEPNTSAETISMKLRGEPGSKIVLSLVRNNEIFHYMLTREVIKILPVQYTIFEDIVYMKIIYFTDNVRYKVQKVLKRYGKMKGLILDLRNNPGGQFDEAIDICGLFLPPSVIIKVVSRLPQYNKLYCSSGQDLIPSVPMAVLINGGSASASEIVAAALKHYHRAHLIGKITLGKGSMQEIYPLPGYGGFKMTVAHFFDPGGLPIHKTGVEPDEEIEDPEVFSPRFYWPRMVQTDPQFQAAVAYVKRRIEE